MRYISDDSSYYIRFVKKLVKDRKCVIGFYFCDPFNDNSCYRPAIRVLYRIERDNVFVDSIFHYSSPTNQVNSDIMSLFILFFVRRGAKVYIPRTIEEKMDLMPIFPSNDYIDFVTGDNKYAVFFKI